MDKHRKKMIAPVIIAILFILYMILYITTLFITAGESSLVKLLFAVPALLLAYGMVFTLKSRIHEIRSGEEDDLDNY
ncbi:MAG: hypothetical protein IIY55_10700 [Blautia sp.]|nr:hypothetical protein [Blautia sp.]